MKKPNSYFLNRYKEVHGGKSNLKNTQKHDKIKTDYCRNNNIKLLRIKYNEDILEKLKNNIKELETTCY